MKIRLIRHGMTAANEKKLYCGITDLPLSENGVTELCRVKSKPHFSPDGLYVTSGLMRAVQTMEILFDKKPDVIMPELNEMNFGVFEMKSYGELKDEPDYIRWITEGENTCCPNGESGKTFAERVNRGFYELLRVDAESVIVVTHGGVIVTIMEKLFPNQRNFYEWQPGYGRGYILEIDKGGAASWQNP